MNKSYIKICDDLLKEYLILKHGCKCQLCDIGFKKEELMPIHILTKKAYPNLRYYMPNVRLGCDDCHREEEKFHELYNIYGDKLKLKSVSMPLLKHQDAKEKLKKHIQELK
jgi:hypothetical protein